MLLGLVVYTIELFISRIIDDLFLILDPDTFYECEAFCLSVSFFLDGLRDYKRFIASSIRLRLLLFSNFYY